MADFGSSTKCYWVRIPIEVQSRPDFEVDMIQAEGRRKAFGTNKPFQALLRKISQPRLVLH